MSDQPRDTRVAAVVIGRNEGSRLTTALRSVRSQSDVLVYVDSGSIDHSLLEATNSGACVVSLDMSKTFSAARARNAGFAAVLVHDPGVEFVQFMDGDCELNSPWLEIAIGFLRAHPEIGLVCGRRRERFPNRTIYNKLCDIEWDTPVGEANECGGDCLVRVDAFKQVGGFSDHIIAGEEPELCARLRLAGWKVWRLNAEMTSHDANIIFFWQWWRRSVRCGYAYATLSHLHGSGPDRLKRREVISAFAWGVVIPATILIGSLLYLPLIAASALYPVQAFRIGLRETASDGKRGTKYGAFVLLGKFAECVGISKYALSQVRNRTHSIIEYK